MGCRQISRRGRRSVRSDGRSRDGCWSTVAPQRRSEHVSVVVTTPSRLARSRNTPCPSTRPVPRRSAPRPGSVRAVTLADGRAQHARHSLPLRPPARRRLPAGRPARAAPERRLRWGAQAGRRHWLADPLPWRVHHAARGLRQRHTPRLRGDVARQERPRDRVRGVLFGERGPGARHRRWLRGRHRGALAGTGHRSARRQGAHHARLEGSREGGDDYQLGGGDRCAIGQPEADHEFGSTWRARG
jgi:hypothetical protein